MKPEQIERVFGRGRLKMATGEHVEVFREAVGPAQRRRYTKRFLATDDADFGQWTEREWRILARLIGHGIRCVPDVVQFDGGAQGGMRQVQTYDAGVTVDQWATLLPVGRDSVVRRHLFEDCAHWWALAHHCLGALEEIHALQLVHLDVKADNICIPYGPAGFDPRSGDRLHAVFDRLALIDFAFSLVSRERLATPLPIGWQKDYDYQSPRLLRALEAGRAGDLRPTQELDWRCDLYSLAAMLRRYLPDDEWARSAGVDAGWTPERYGAARALVYRLRECHDRDIPHWRPHRELMEQTSACLAAPDLARSLSQGWTLVLDPEAVGATSLITPMTRIEVGPTLVTRPTAISLPVEAPISVPAVMRNPRLRARPVIAPVSVIAAHSTSSLSSSSARPVAARPSTRTALAATLAAVAAMAAPSFIGHPVTSQDAPQAPPARRAAAPVAPVDASAQAAPAPDVPQAPRAQRAAAPVAPVDASAQATPAPDATPPEPARAERVLASAEKASTPMATTHPAPAAGASPAANEKVATVEPRVPRSDKSDRVPVEARGASSPVGASHARYPVSRIALGGVPDKPARSADGTIGASALRGTRDREASPRPPAAPVQRSANVARAGSAAAATRASARSPAPPASPGNAEIAAQPALVSVTAAPAPDIIPVEHVADAAPAAAVTPSVPADARSTATPPQRGAVVASAPAPSATTPSATPQSATPQSATMPSATMPSATMPSATMPSATMPSATMPSVDKSHRDAWRVALHDVLKLFGPIVQRPAPVEERSAAAPRVAARAVPRPDPPAARTIASADPRPVEIARAMPVEAQAVPPLEPARRGVGSANAALAVEVRPPATSGALMIEARLPTPVAAPGAQDDLAQQGRRMLFEVVPRVAAQAGADAYPVLWSAAMAETAAQERAVIDASYVPWRSERAYPLSTIGDPRARQLHEEARRAYAAGRDSEALDLSVRGLAANPRDPDIAGFLAFLHLKLRPAQAETARQLALHALAFSGSRRSQRPDDWHTLAVASALAGRDVDARRALLVELAVSENADRSCRSALGAYTTYGERLRGPVEALLRRVHAQGRDYAAPACAWPAFRTLARAP